ncbi:MAG TPA: DUF3152 domain-containing protein [Dermatophilaceae bacterium]|nr:DUF3152 domain-containing protein [Dermatophilaceae bacterium]
MPAPNTSPPRLDVARGARRPVSRRVRRHRTLTAAVTLVLLVAAVVVWAGRRGGDTLPGPVAGVTRAAPAPAATLPPAPAPASSTPVSAASTAVPGTSGQQADGAASGAADTSTPPKVVQQGTGNLRVVPVPGPQSTAAGRVVGYTLEIEDGLGLDLSAVATTVRSVLLDARGWQAKDNVRFVNISPQQEAAGAPVDIRITLASPSLTDRLCAPLRTLGQVSCWNGSRHRSVLNLRRWLLGIPAYGNLELYRVYQINHEVGHGLGHNHQYCPRPGARASVMQQQSLGMQGCRAWPYPTT